MRLHHMKYFNGERNNQTMEVTFHDMREDWYEWRIEIRDMYAIFAQAGSITKNDRGAWAINTYTDAYDRDKLKEGVFLYSSLESAQKSVVSLAERAGKRADVFLNKYYEDRDMILDQLGVGEFTDISPSSRVKRS